MKLELQSPNEASADLPKDDVAIAGLELRRGLGILRLECLRRRQSAQLA